MYFYMGRIYATTIRNTLYPRRSYRVLLSIPHLATRIKEINSAYGVRLERMEYECEKESE